MSLSLFFLLYPSDYKVVCHCGVFLYFFKDFIYLFLERGEGWETERKRNINVWLPLMCPLLGTWPTTQACALTGNRTGDPLVHSLHSIHWAKPARAVFLICISLIINNADHFTCLLTLSLYLVKYLSPHILISLSYCYWVITVVHVVCIQLCYHI